MCAALKPSRIPREALISTQNGQPFNVATNV
jgi:hypothetical protein